MSKVYFDGIFFYKNFQNKCRNADYKIFEGNFPHLHRFYYDPIGNSVCFFTEMFKMKVVPLL